MGLRTQISPATILISTPGIGVPQETTSTPSISAVRQPAASVTAKLFSAIALQGQKVVLDFNRQQMMLKPARRHASGDMVLPAQSPTGQLIVTRAWYGNQPIAVVIDTGSWLSVGNGAMRRLLKHPPRSYGRVVMTSVTGRSFSADFVSVDEIPRHPHWQDRGDMIDVAYPESGRTYTHLAGPYKHSRSYWEIRGRAPLLGEHNEEILVGELGVDKAKLTALAESGVI